MLDSRQDAALQSDMVDQADRARRAGHHHPARPDGIDEGRRPARGRRRHQGGGFRRQCRKPQDPADRAVATTTWRALALEQAVKDNGESWNAGYVYVAGIAPLDRRNETWVDVKKKYAGIKEVAMFGTLDNPIANSVANQARSVLSAHPDIKVMFAPYDEFAKGVKIAVDEAGLNKKIKIYSADISTSDIAAMREPDSAWAATAATNPAVVGQVSVRALAQLLAGEDPGKQLRQSAHREPDRQQPQRQSLPRRCRARTSAAIPRCRPNDLDALVAAGLARAVHALGEFVIGGKRPPSIPGGRGPGWRRNWRSDCRDFLDARIFFLDVDPGLVAAVERRDAGDIKSIACIPALAIVTDRLLEREAGQVLSDCSICGILGFSTLTSKATTLMPASTARWAASFINSVRPCWMMMPCTADGLVDHVGLKGSILAAVEHAQVDAESAFDCAEAPRPGRSHRCER